jgi:methyl-accepting chemotaxis protein WspA
MKTSRWQALSISQVALILLLLLGVGLTFWMESAQSWADMRAERLNHDVDRLRLQLHRMNESLRGALLDPGSETERRQRDTAEADTLALLETLLKNPDYRSEVQLNIALGKLRDFIVRESLPYQKRLLELVEKQQDADARKIFVTDATERRQRREGLLNDLASQAAKYVEAQSNYAQTVSRIALPAILVVLVACFFVGRAQSAAVSRPLNELVAMLDRMRGGDFSRRINWKRADEFGVLGEGLNRLAGDLSGLVAQVQRSGIMVNTSATEIAASAKEQQSTATEIAATTAEIGATSKEISATSKELVKTMSEVTKVSEDTAQLANTGQSAINRMEANMRQIIEASGSISAKLATLNERTANINSVVTTITKVADQTNLLSLNAAIEAEKAGEYGLGFAVVAMEIRRLADQTAVATYDIEKMVKEMQSAVAAGVMGMDKFSDEVRRGVEEVRQVSTQLAQIIHQVQTLSPRFHTVNEGMHAQATGAQQISETLVQLSESAHQTAESLRLSNLAIEQLNEAARGLQTSVARFRLEGA